VKIKQITSDMNKIENYNVFLRAHVDVSLVMWYKSNFAVFNETFKPLTESFNSVWMKI